MKERKKKSFDYIPHKKLSKLDFLSFPLVKSIHKPIRK